MLVTEKGCGRVRCVCGVGGSGGREVQGQSGWSCRGSGGALQGALVRCGSWLGVKRSGWGVERRRGSLLAVLLAR